MSIGISSTVTPGTYTITVKGVGGGVTKRATYTLTVTQQPAPFDYSISVNPSSILVARGSSNTSSISVNLLSGTSQSVSLSVTGCELAGAICSASPNNGNPTFQSTFNVITFFNSTTGTYPVTITGTGGGVTRTASASVTIV